MSQSLKLALTLSVLVALLSEAFPVLPQISEASQDRISGPVTDSDLVTLRGNTHPLARPEFDRGEIDPETRLDRLVLVLKPSAAQQGELDQLTEAQQEPGSADYHRWLSPAEYGSRFGVSTRDIVRIAGWLQKHGFAVEQVTAGRNLVLFSGTATQVATTFHTTIHRYAVGRQIHIANAGDPQIPEALAEVVTGVLSLHDFRRASASTVVRAVANPQNTQGSGHYLFPADFATIYNLNPLYGSGINGAGVSIAIVGRSNINPGDVNTFRATAGLAANPPAVIVDGANPGLVKGDQDEATLDLEWSGAIAPAALVKYVVAASTATSDGVDLSAQYIVNHKTAPVMSTSFGSCEADMGSAALAFYNALWQQAASEGISVFVASGDSGAAGCSEGSSSRGSEAAVNGLCSSPYSTCVGGTEFKENGADWGTTNGAGGESALGYIPEEVWNESGENGGSGLWSSGGGVSTVYLQPSWQTGVAGAVYDGMRAVPDVSLTAAAHDGYLVLLNGSWYVFAGTSASAPSFAGVMSLVDQKQGGTSQGNANPALYGLLDGSINAFHATPTGNNSVPGVSGFAASGEAYNLATGLGSVDANLLVHAWPSGSSRSPAPPATLALKVSPSQLRLKQGKSISLPVTVNAGGSFTGSVMLAVAGLPAGVAASWSVNGFSLVSGHSVVSTLTLTASPSAPLTTTTLKITASGDDLVTKLSEGLQVTATPGVSLAVSPGSVSMPSTATQSVLCTVTMAGGVKPASNMAGVSFAAAGMPAGISVAWGKPTLTGAGTIQAVLTLTGSKSAVASNSRLPLTTQVRDSASGTSYAASAQLELVVSKVSSTGPAPVRAR